jgi:hypothetical protein
VAHVLARLAGHGLVLTPYWPYSFERQPTERQPAERQPAGHDAVLATRLLEHDRRQALVDPAAPAGQPGIVTSPRDRTTRTG